MNNNENNNNNENVKNDAFLMKQCLKPFDH